VNSLRAMVLAEMLVASSVLLLLPPLAEASGRPGRFTIGADTVFDTVTGLTWQRATAGPYSWNAATSYCAGLSLGGIAAGGWRLPRKLELESIVDLRAVNSAIDQTAFPNTPLTDFWASSPSERHRWFVNFASGSSQRADTSASVRCVH
jgi:hypothetical protein